jgi:hypothetical protein
MIVHADSIGCLQPNSKLYKFALPFTTALACGVQKVFNTELGFMRMPENVLQEPLWLCMTASIAALGLLDFYLNLRAAQRMSVQVFVPCVFAFGIAFQCFQGMIVFAEFQDMSVECCVLTALGIFLALIGALIIQLERTHEIKYDLAGNERYMEAAHETLTESPSHALHHAERKAAPILDIYP